MFDVWVMLAFGVIGYGLERLKIPLAPLVIGLVLAPIGEEHLSAGLMQSGGSWLPLLTQPISLVLCVVAAVLYAENVYDGGTSARMAVFEVVSIFTTTGFATADFAMQNVAL